MLYSENFPKKIFLSAFDMAEGEARVAVDATTGASPRRAKDGVNYYAQKSGAKDLAIPFEAKNLYYNFTEDEKTSKRLYGKDRISVTGVVKYAGRDRFGEPSIMLSDTAEGQDYVLFVFPSFDDIEFAHVGDQVTLSGEFHIMSSRDNLVVIKRARRIELIPVSPNDFNS